MKIMKFTCIFLLTCLVSYGQIKRDDSTKQVTLYDPDIMAEYPGGMSAYHKFIQDSVISKIVISREEQYTLRASYSKFTVTETGKIVNVKIIKSSNISRIDSIFKHALEKMPDWKPAIINGQPQRQDFNIPLRLELK